jgi:hypothetical protein
MLEMVCSEAFEKEKETTAKIFRTAYNPPPQKLGLH